MIDLSAQKLKKSDIDDVLDVIVEYNSVLIQTDMVGFATLIKEYSGWLSSPSKSVDLAYMQGVHSSGLGLTIHGSNNFTGMSFLESLDNPSLIEQLLNYK